MSAENKQDINNIKSKPNIGETIIKNWRDLRFYGLWSELLETMPDNLKNEAHETIMKLQKQLFPNECTPEIDKIIRLFEEENEKCVYLLDLLYEGDKSYSNYDTVFDSLKSVRIYLDKDIKEMTEFFEGDNRLIKYRIKKIWLNNDCKRIVIEFNKKNEYLDFNYENIMEDIKK